MHNRQVSVERKAQVYKFCIQRLTPENDSAGTVTACFYFWPTGRTFRLQPFSFPTDAIEGNKVSTMCATVTGGISSGVEFTWFKDGRKLVQDDRIRVRSFPDMSTLVVDSLRQEDSGNYTCVGKLRNQKDSHTETLRVLGKWPRMLESPFVTNKLREVIYLYLDYVSTS